MVVAKNHISLEIILRSNYGFSDSFKNVAVVIIDEFSMMKSSLLYHLYMRLCDLKQTDDVMVGVSVNLLGMHRKVS